MGATMQMTPIMARLTQSGSALLSAAWKVFCLTGAAAAIWGVTLLFMPSQTGIALLGSSWSETRPLLPIWAAYYLASGLTMGAIGLPATGQRA